MAKGRMVTKKTSVKKSSKGKTSRSSTDMSRRAYLDKKGERNFERYKEKLNYKRDTARMRSSVQKSGIRSAAVTGTGTSAIRESEETERSKNQKTVIEPKYRQNEQKIVDQSQGGIGGSGGSDFDYDDF